MYVYENHLGGLFTSDRELSYEECYCKPAAIMIV